MLVTISLIYSEWFEFLYKDSREQTCGPAAPLIRSSSGDVAVVLPLLSFVVADHVALAGLGVLVTCRPSEET